MRITASALLMSLCVAPISGNPSEDPVQITVTPASCMTPCNVRLTVRVAPDEANRSVTIAAESVDFSRSSTRQLDGTDGPRLHELLLMELPAGPYDVHVVVSRANEPRAERSAHFAVYDGTR